MKVQTFIRTWVSQCKDPSASTFLFLLLTIDVVLVFLHFLLVTPFFNNLLFNIENDSGYPEFYQYIKELWIALLLVLVLVKTRMLGLAVWALLFLYLLFDDALQLHERIGGHLVTQFGFTPLWGLRAQDFGELAVSAIAGSTLVVLLALFYFQGQAAFKQITRHLFLFLIAIAFFGIFIDMLHVALDVRWRITFLLGVLEDGGEMLVMSLIAWYVFLLHLRNGDIGITLRPPT